MNNNTPGINAIVTAYRGFSFRSRLEARYAAFFDANGWQWTYEPFDCNGWIPDFVIGERHTAVEIKPYGNRPEEWSEAIRKIADSGYRQPVLLLGVDPTTWGVNATRQGRYEDIGMVFEWRDFDAGVADCVQASFGVVEGPPCVGLEQTGIVAMDGYWRNLVWNLEGKPARVCLYTNEQRERLLVNRWATACNITQWHPRAKTVDECQTASRRPRLSLDLTNHTDFYEWGGFE